MPLNEFIALVCSSAGSESTALHDLEVRAMRDAIFPSQLPSTRVEELQPSQKISQTPLDVFAELRRRRS